MDLTPDIQNGFYHQGECGPCGKKGPMSQFDGGPPGNTDRYPPECPNCGSTQIHIITIDLDEED